MAKYKAGPAVAEARGTVGGTVFSRNRYGLYMRSGASPVQPRSTPQEQIRAAFTYVSQYWRDVLTPALRAAWEDYASQTPLTDAFGDKMVLSGNAMFCRFNAHWYRRNLPILTAAPATPGEAPMLSCVLTGTTADGIKLASFNPPLLAADHIAILACSAPVSQARNFYNGPFTDRAWPTGTEVLPLLLVVPALVAVGQRWFFQFRAFTAIGKCGPRSQFKVDILA